MIASNEAPAVGTDSLFSIAAIRVANANAGQVWFAPDTIRWHGTRVSSTVAIVEDGSLFVTSEWDGFDRVGRAYTLRWASNGTHPDYPRGAVETVGEYLAYPTRGAALTALRRARAGWPGIDVARRGESFNSKVWADAFGVWHASVPLSGSAQRDANTARDAIRQGMRDAIGTAEPDADYVIRVTREHVTAHGTAVYREV